MLQLKVVDKHLRQVDIFQQEGFLEERGHLLRCVACDAATHGGDEEGQLGVLLGTGDEMVDGSLHRGFALHGGQSIAATRKSFADTPFSSEVLVGKPGGTAAVGALDIAAENKYLVLAEGGDTVRRNAATIDILCVFHIVRVLDFRLQRYKIKFNV